MLKPAALVMKKFAKLCCMRRGVNIISLWYILVYILCNQGRRTAATGGGDIEPWPLCWLAAILNSAVMSVCKCKCSVILQWPIYIWK